MIRKFIDPWLEWFKRVITQPRHELDRWQSAVRFAYDLGVHGYRALQRDNAPQMAAALAFRSLFAMLPVVVVSAVLVKAMQGMDQFKNLSTWLIDVLGANAVRVPVTQAAGDLGEPVSVPLAQWLSEQIDKMASLNLAALGWVGFAVMVYSAISLMVTIENSFNSIYGAPEGRSWMRRIPIYWFVLTLGPLFIGLTIVVNNQFESFISGVGQLQWLLAAVKFVYGFCAAWLFMFAVYRLVPNTRVATRAALAGGFIAALFWQVGRSMLGAYFGSAGSLGNLYAVLGSVPIFMFFVYLMWLVVLFGLEVSATVQSVQGRPIEELEEKHPPTGLVDPASVVNVMEVVTERFALGRAITTREITEQTRIHEVTVCAMVDRLVRDGFLHRIDGSDGAVSLARPPDAIAGDRLIEIGFSLADESAGGRMSPLVQRLREVQRRLAAQTTLAGLLSVPASSGPANQANAG